jgi:imidazole glycerol-phosphate synthase subunit HisH
MKKISIIDYGTGNYSSIIGMLNKFDCDVQVTNKIKDLEKSEIIILPGVGTYPNAMNSLKKNNLISFLKKAFKKRKKILGICLGMQLLTSSSDEVAKTKGLNLIPGKTCAIKSNSHHIGWNKLFIKNKKSIYAKLDKKFFYFQHKFIVKTRLKYQNAFSLNSEKIPSFISYKNITGIQFHPEKSQKSGTNFFKIYLND